MSYPLHCTRLPLRIVVALAVCLFAVTLPGGARAERIKKLSPVTYRDWDGQTLQLVPWQGKHVTLLLQPGPRSTRVLGQIIGALDRSWFYYAKIAGRRPKPLDSLHGRDEIAEVPTLNICGGAACTFLGHTGGEILPTYFNALYDDVATLHEYDQILFYEFGRSFWFWGRQLAPEGVGDPFGNSVTTGYAVLMRWESMRAEHIPGGPVIGPTGQLIPFLQSRRQMSSLLSYYVARPTLTFADTLAQDKSPEPGVGQGTDFWASIMWNLAARYGGNRFLERFFAYASDANPVRTVPGAVTDWVASASDAACVNLRPLFYRQWGFPRPNGRVTRRPRPGTVRWPRGSCRR